MAADSVAVNTPPITPNTTISTAKIAQIDVPSCLISCIKSNLSPLG